MDSRVLKENIKPTMVALMYLGSPIRSNSLGLWYKSPFRNERIASFLVSDNKGIHDFGSSKHFDIISFTQEAFKIDFKTAMLKLYKDFNIIDSHESSRELNVYLIKQRQEEILIKKKINSWFYKIFNLICDKLKEIKIIKTHVSGYALAEIYKHESSLEYWSELFLEANEEEKYELFKSRKEIEKCLLKF